MDLKLLCIAAVLVGVVVAGEVDYWITTPHMCNVTSVGISRCSRGKRCVLRKGVSTSLRFVFQPKFHAEKLEGWLMSIQDDGFDKPISKILNVCDMTPCPADPWYQQEVHYIFRVRKSQRKGTGAIKFQMWDQDNQMNRCSFATTINVD